MLFFPLIGISGRARKIPAVNTDEVGYWEDIGKSAKISLILTSSCALSKEMQYQRKGFEDLLEIRVLICILESPLNSSQAHANDITFFQAVEKVGPLFHPLSTIVPASLIIPPLQLSRLKFRG